MNTSNTMQGGQETIKAGKPQVGVVAIRESFDREPQGSASGKGEQRDLLAETLAKWEIFESQQR